MAFKPSPNDRVTIEKISYLVAEHPLAPGMPYGQEGRRAVVYQLLAENGEKFALKVFKSRFRTPGMVSVAETLEPYASLDGLQACQRIVLTGSKHPDLLRKHPDLAYAVLMPWVEGLTWQEILLEPNGLAPDRSLEIARAFARQLMTLEEKRLAHCDLSGANLIIQPDDLPALVDLEEMYGPGFVKPDSLPAGSQGYAHKTAPRGLWSPTADRFTGAILLMEMLCWHDPAVREAAWGESYFASKDMQTENKRLDILCKSLEKHFGKRIFTLFGQVWYSDSLRDCPTFAEWVVALPEKVKEKGSATQTDLKPVEASAEEGDALTYYLEGQESAEEGDYERALELYRKAISLAPSGQSRKIEKQIASLERGVKQEQEPLEEPVPAATDKEERYPERPCSICEGMIPAGREVCPRCEGIRKPRRTSESRTTSGPTQLSWWQRYGGWLGAGGLLLAFLAVLLIRGGSTPLLMKRTKTPQPALSIGSTQISEIDGMVQAYIPAGEFLMGRENGDSDETPAHEVYLDGYWMDEHEVTNAQFAAFLNQNSNQEEDGMTWLDAEDGDALIGKSFGEWVPLSEYADHPVVEVTWYGARAYCEWAGRRLPTEAEWEKAAREGQEGMNYPLGDEPPVCTIGTTTGAQFFVCLGSREIPVKSFSPNGYGLYDMAGNVWEWVADWYDKDYYEITPQSLYNPQGPTSGDYRVLRGGSWIYYVANRMGAANRRRSIPSTTDKHIGFRCAASPE